MALYYSTLSLSVTVMTYFVVNRIPTQQVLALVGSKIAIPWPMAGKDGLMIELTSLNL